MADKKPLVVYAASYESLSSAEADLDAIEQLHKDKVIGEVDAAVIDKQNGKPHVAKRLDRPRSVSSLIGSAAGPCRARSFTRWPSNSPPARQD